MKGLRPRAGCRAVSLCRGAFGFASSDINHPWPFERLVRAPCARWRLGWPSEPRASRPRSFVTACAPRSAAIAAAPRLRFAQLYPPYRCAGTRRWRRRARQAHCAHALVGACRGPAATGRHRGCGAESRMRALRRYRVMYRYVPRWRALPCLCCGVEGAWDRGSRVMRNGPRGPRAILPAT